MDIPGAKFTQLNIKTLNIKTKTMKTKQLKRALIWSGPSLIDGKPIALIAIKGSKNIKTGGGLIQSYIIRTDMSPLDASKSGADISICGSCMHRGKPTDNPNKKQAEKRSCYVNLGQGPTIVYKGLQRGIYPEASPEEIKRFSVGYNLRMGSYGDPAAVPREVWDMLLSGAHGHTGYTHNASIQPSIVELCMISADNEAQSINALNDGKRTFRVIPLSVYEAKGNAAVMKNEIICPASKESKAQNVTCDKCMLCNGSNGKGKSIAIVAHGVGKYNMKG